jgi:hypothetical protein
MKKALFIFFVLLSCSVFAQESVFSISGKWKFKLDSADKGKLDKWFVNPNFTQVINFPGTLDDGGIGEVPLLDTTKMNENVMQRLARKHRFVGPVWYSRQFFVDSRGTFDLSLERVIWNTECWVDGVYAGKQQRLSTPQHFFLKDIKRGVHSIVLRIDNRKQFDISIDDLAAAYTDDTQIIWNGVIGAISLTKQRSGMINDLQVYPDITEKSIKVNTILEKLGSIEIPVKQVINLFYGNRIVASLSVPYELKNIQTQTTSVIKLEHMYLWDEFNPHLYRLEVSVFGIGAKVLDKKALTTGFRQLSNKGSLLQVNGRRIFLRGTLDCDIYPLTGHPPMNKAGWSKVFNTARSYGLNHIRFHSWCPPEAAFSVADSIGFYLQVELPLWSLSVGKDKPTLKFLDDEANDIIKNYGNHPSFCFWSMGNELEGDFTWLNKLVIALKNKDPRHLYTSTTFSFQKGHGISPEPVADYFVTQYTKKGWVRGQGIFNTMPPDFQTDYTKSVDSIPVPLIIHEMGQYSVYPDLKEIKQYMGVLDPMNLKAVRYDLAKKGMLSLDEQFVKASGELAVILYKEEIERALKTPGISGFQLLDLHDFPGQGTALVGLLNAFWKSKGLISPANFQNFCSPVVPLLRFSKANYSNNETFAASAQLANFSEKALNVAAVWSATDNDNKVLFKGSFKKQKISVGNNNSLGEFDFKLNKIIKAKQLKITLSIPGTAIKNQWKIWVYPAELRKLVSAVKFTTSPEEAVKLLAYGDIVILNPDTSRIKGVSGRFAPVFWSPVHFTDQPGTMGILCNPNNPALKDFPTSFYTDWQWWDLVSRSKAMVIDSLVGQQVPIVRVIDNFFRNKKMAAILEFKVGTGKLILCSMDIHSNLQERPAARQLRYSLMNYAGTKYFNPIVNINEYSLSQFFK